LALQGTELKLESEIGKGSCFYFTQQFPLGEEEPEGEEVHHTIFENKENILRGVGILLVEDNPFNVMVAKSILERYGTEVDLASDGVEALQKFDNKRHRLVLMDLHMPEMDGYEATDILRKSGETVPIIALTASTKNEVENEVFAAGLTDVIVKPFNPEDLLSVILKCLNEDAFKSYHSGLAKPIE
jgi:CheY-like chemotaxis protein